MKPLLFTYFKLFIYVFIASILTKFSCSFETLLLGFILFEVIYLGENK